jgi:hypothetical protein
MCSIARILPDSLLLRHPIAPKTLIGYTQHFNVRFYPPEQDLTDLLPSWLFNVPPFFMPKFRSFFLSFWLLFILSTLSAQSKKAQGILDNEVRRFEAMVRADPLGLQPLLADELIYIHSNALKEIKLAHLNAISSRKLVYEKIEREAASVRIYGKTGLVNGTLKAKGILNGTAFEVRLLYIAVYRKKQSVWQLVHWQSTRML